MAEEKQFENKIKKYLTEHGHYHIKFFANAFTPAGIPDILACVNGRWVSIEVKASKGRPSELQLYNREEIRKAGGISIILYPKQFEEFKEFIKCIEEGSYVFETQYKFD